MPWHHLLKDANHATSITAERGWPRQAELAYALAMISMATLEELYAQNHSLAMYCVDCDRWDTADLPDLIRRGFGPRLLVDTRFRCRDCGSIADKQLRPPVPQIAAAVSYI